MKLSSLNQIEKVTLSDGISIRVRSARPLSQHKRTARPILPENKHHIHRRMEYTFLYDGKELVFVEKNQLRLLDRLEHITQKDALRKYGYIVPTEASVTFVKNVVKAAPSDRLLADASVFPTQNGTIMLSLSRGNVKATLDVGDHTSSYGIINISTLASASGYITNGSMPEVAVFFDKFQNFQ